MVDFFKLFLKRRHLSELNPVWAKLPSHLNVILQTVSSDHTTACMTCWLEDWTFKSRLFNNCYYRILTTQCLCIKLNSMFTSLCFFPRTWESHKIADLTGVLHRTQKSCPALLYLRKVKDMFINLIS